jgi:hypothetical protein
MHRRIRSVLSGCFGSFRLLPFFYKPSQMSSKMVEQWCPLSLAVGHAFDLWRGALHRDRLHSSEPLYAEGNPRVRENCSSVKVEGVRVGLSSDHFEFPMLCALG